MFNIKGHVTIQVVDETTGEIVREIEQDNIITDTTYRMLAGSSRPDNFYDAVWDARNIFISDEVATPIRSKAIIRCMGTATQKVGQPNPQLYVDANPMYWVLTQRINSTTGAARTFTSVGLTNSNPGEFTNPAVTNVIPYAYLLLNTPCTQESNQFLNLIYRISFDETAPIGATTQPSRIYLQNFLAYIFTSALQGNTNSSINYAQTARAPLKSYNWNFLHSPQSFSSNFGLFNRFNVNINNVGVVYAFGQGDQPSLFYRKKIYYFADRTTSSNVNGHVINGITYGFSTNIPNGASGVVVNTELGNVRVCYNSSNLNTTKVLQSAFGYNNPNADRGPQFLPDNVPTGTGGLVFTESNWSGTWPTLYRIRIVRSGNATTAKYVIGTRNYTTFASDTNFVYATASKGYHPYIINFAQPYPRCHGWQPCNFIIAYKDNWTLQADLNGVSLIDQFTGQHFDYDGVNGLPITSFRQLAFRPQSNLIYVACSVTGLWKIDVTNMAAPIITQETTQGCYAVDLNNVGVVYALVNLSSTNVRLTSSASTYTANLGFTAVDLQTSMWTFLYVNKLSPDIRIAISVAGGYADNNFQNQKNATVYWWSLANNPVVNTVNFAVRFSGEMQTGLAWMNGSSSKMWSCRGNLLTFGVATGLGTSPTGDRALGSSYQVSYNNPASTLTDEFTPYTKFTRQDGTLFANTGAVNFNTAQVLQDEWGNLQPTNATLVFINGVGNNSLGDLLLASTGEQVISVNRTQLEGPNFKAVMMPNNLVLSGRVHYAKGNSQMNNIPESWTWYKWNGSNWVKSTTFNTETGVYSDDTFSLVQATREATGRDCSTTATPLLDGISARFITGTVEPSFVVGEVYDQYVNQGVLKTNDNSLYLEVISNYSQPVFNNVTLTSTTIPATFGIVLNGAPGNTAVNPATSAVAVNPLWHSVIPEYITDNMLFNINGVAATRVFCETIDTMPLQSALTIGQIALFRNGLMLFSSVDVGKTVTGYFSYIARSN